MKTPCIVITRDRVSYTKLCIESLERFSNQLDIHIVDHGSTWPAMLQYLDSSPHPVHRCDDRMPRDLWSDRELIHGIVGDSCYLVTDPDLIFDAACPDDWLDKLCAVLHRHHGDVAKVGLSLRIDDLPPILMSERVQNWEGQFWLSRLDADAWRAPVDTTLALYPSISVVAPAFRLVPAARLDAPYLLRHLPWYGESGPEVEYYREHLVPGSSHWAKGGW